MRSQHHFKGRFKQLTKDNQINVLKKMADDKAKAENIPLFDARLYFSRMLRFRLSEIVDPEVIIEETIPKKLPEIDRSGKVYVVQLTPKSNPARIKVGYSTNMEARLMQFRNSCPNCRLIGHWEGNTQTEKQVLTFLSQICTYIGGEVFECEDISWVTQVVHIFTFYRLEGNNIDVNVDNKELLPIIKSILSDVYAITCLSIAEILDAKPHQLSPILQQYCDKGMLRLKDKPIISDNECNITVRQYYLGEPVAMKDRLFYPAKSLK